MAMYPSTEEPPCRPPPCTPVWPGPSRPRTHFQFRALGDEPLAAVGVTMPPWPGVGELDGRGEVDLVDGPWAPTVESGLGA